MCAGGLLAISGGVFRASLDFSFLHGCLQVLTKSDFLELNMSDCAFRWLGRALLGTSGASRRLSTNVIDFSMISVVFVMNLRQCHTNIIELFR